MFKPDIAEKEPRRRAAGPECCSDAECEAGVRNRYFVGKKLTPDAFTVEQRYLVERRHLMNRAVLGSGVVYGYPVKPAAPLPHETKKPTGRLSIGPGLALDAAGRELVQIDTLDLRVVDLIFLDPESQRADLHRQRRGGCWLLRVHYAERDIHPTTLNDPCNCTHTEWDQVCETVRFSLSPIDCKACCDPQRCDLHCSCARGPCCREGGVDPKGPQPSTPDPVAPAALGLPPDQRMPPQQSANPVRRGGCQCLCDYLTELDCEVHARLCPIEEPCGRVRVDLEHGVPLACVKIDVDDCGCWFFSEEVEACGPRRLVKRNDVLFDLIRGCDLTRITRVGWAPWHRADRPIAFDKFARSWGNDGPKGCYITNDYWVEFSRPVRAATVRADCFAMTVLAPDRSGWLTPLRVPILNVKTNEGEYGLPSGHVTRATIVVDAKWVEHTIREQYTVFADDPTCVEIEVLGDYMIDCNGQAVDANAIGRSPAPTGNGVPGDRFMSKFAVEAPPDGYEYKPDKQGV